MAAACESVCALDHEVGTANRARELRLLASELEPLGQFAGDVHAVADLVLAASVVKTWSYLLLKYRASLARRPARATATGDDWRPSVETVTKSTGPDMCGSYHGPHVQWRRRCRVSSEDQLELHPERPVGGGRSAVTREQG